MLEVPLSDITKKMEKFYIKIWKFSNMLENLEAIIIKFYSRWNLSWRAESYEKGKLVFVRIAYKLVRGDALQILVWVKKSRDRNVIRD